ncbi:MAG: tetraacyldisaccharide 4'-kinase [Elusimicrobiota bacterium]|nr:tetraacyldisaccharide 4'-kinase [Elusimicrobiota bacterium]
MKNNLNLDFYKNLIYKKSNWHLLNILLKILSFFYIFLLFSRNLLYKIGILKIFKVEYIFVISVGNITTGGTGKTPILLKIIDILKKNILKKEIKSKNIAVISRGYKRKSKNIKIITPLNLKNENLRIEEIGDEPFMIRKREPEIFLGIGGNRKKVIQELLNISKNEIKYIILDDVFQKISIYKNLNIILIDVSANFLFFQDFILPRGTLREPIENIKKADFIILTKTNLAEHNKIKKTIEKLNDFGFNKNNIILSEYIPSYFLNFDNHKIEIKDFFKKESKSNILTAIGNPSSFEKTIKNLDFEGNLNILHKYFFADHHWFKKENLIKAISNCDYVLTTEKDFVKIKELINTESIYFSKFDASKFYCLIMETKFDDFKFLDKIKEIKSKQKG